MVPLALFVLALGFIFVLIRLGKIEKRMDEHVSYHTYRDGGGVES